MRLRQTTGPLAPQARWKEHFYSGALDVVNGEVETDNENWINQLRERGFTPVDDLDDTPKRVLGKVTYDSGPALLGTQTAAAANTEKAREKVEKLLDSTPPSDAVASDAAPRNAVPSDVAPNNLTDEEKADRDFLANTPLKEPPLAPKPRPTKRGTSDLEKMMQMAMKKKEEE